jgi:hypothetical protein
MRGRRRAQNFRKNFGRPATLRTLEAGSGTEEESRRHAAAIQMRGSEESAELSQELSAGAHFALSGRDRKKVWRKCGWTSEKEG